MVSIFPSLYPDELLYSLYARYKYLLGYSKDSFVWQDLFGLDKSKMRILFHSDLDRLQERVPKGWLPDRKILIREHTLSPVLSLCTKPKVEVDGLSINYEPYIKNGAVRMMENDRAKMGLAYCSECVHEDYERHGETYWRRSQNVRGVFVCTKHHVFLNYVDLSEAKMGSSLVKPISLEDVCDSEKIDSNNPTHILFKCLARDIALLISKRNLSIGKDVLKKTVLIQVEKLGLSFGATPSISKTRELLENTFHYKLQETLGLPGIWENRSSWCRMLVNPIAHTQLCGIVAGLYTLGIRPKDIFPADIKKGSICKNEISKINVAHRVKYPGLPIVRILSLPVRNALIEPIQIRSTVKNLDYRPVILRTKDEKKQVVLIFKKAISWLLTQPETVSFHNIAEFFKIRKCDLKKILHTDPKLKEYVLENLESPYNAAKRRVCSFLETLDLKDNPLSLEYIFMSANAYDYRYRLRSYAKELLALKE